MRVGRMSLAAGVGIACLLLASCGSDGPSGLAGSGDAYEAIAKLGVNCSEPVIATQSQLPYTSVTCVGLRIEWMDDEDGYAALVRADCDATPTDARPAMSAVPLVVGDRWVLRGADSDEPGTWPRAVSPGDAADALGGTVTNAADYCRTVGAWS